MTLLALVLLGFAFARLVTRTPVRFRALAWATLVTASLPACLGLLDHFALRRRSRLPLTFYDAVGAPVTVHEDWVLRPLANPAGLLALACLVTLASLLLPRRELAIATRPRRLAVDLSTIVLAACAAPYLFTFAGALLAPPRGFDALWYHLPAAVELWRAHHLEPPGRDLVFYFPGNLELWAATLLDALGRRALPLVQWPFAVAAALAAHALAQSIGLRRHARFAAALVLATPMVVFQSQLAYADVLGLFCITGAAVFLVRAGRVLDGVDALTHAALAGAALGLALGAKYAALPLVAALAPFALLQLAAPAGRLSARHLPRALALSTIVVVVALLPSWFWYARNLRLTGNPVFPISVPSLGWRGLFASSAFNPGKEHELVAHAWQWPVYPFIEKISHESGFGAAFACLAPLGVIVVGARTLGRLRRGRVSPSLLPLGWGLLYIVFWWLGTNHEARHLLPLVPLLGVPSLLHLRIPKMLPPIAAALAFSTVMTMRTLLFSPVPELSVRPRSFEDAYGFSPALLDSLPDGAKIVNRADRPSNFPLLGPTLRLHVQDFAPAFPSAHDLDSYDAQYLFHRGPPSSLPSLPGWRCVHRAAATNVTWWGSSASDEISLCRHD